MLMLIDFGINDRFTLFFMYEFLGLEISIGTGTTSGASIYTAVPDLFGNLQLVVDLTLRGVN